MEFKMTKKRLIDEDELLDLLNCRNTLTALEQGGVSDWEWYGDSLEGIESIDPEVELANYPEAE